MKKESAFVMLFVLFVLGGSGNIVPVCAAVMGGGGGHGTPCEDMDIIFIMDCSGSMSIMDAEVGGIPVHRIYAAKVAAKDFIDLLPAGTNTRVGVVSYESYGDAEIEQPLTTNFADAKTAIDGLSAGGATAIGEGLEKGRDELTAHGNTNRRVFLLLTDGVANMRPDPWSSPAGWISPPGTWNDNELYAFVEAHDAMTLNVTNPTNIYTVGVGSPTSIHGDFLEVLAHSSGGEYFHYATATSEMFEDVRADICYGDIRVLILSNLDRMDDLGMDPAPSDLVYELQDLADNNPNERGVVVDLGDLCDPSNVEYNADIGTAYSNWDGNEGDVTLTNALVGAIDDYIEDLKQTTYPLMRYVIIVGSHEIIPMEARPDDYSFVTPTVTYNERQWAADSLPLTSGYLYDLYHAGADGHYMTDTPYSDLSYLDTSTDHELTPELSVSRLVETPQQIADVIDTYMAANGIIPRNHFVSIASYDYLDGGTLASDYMTAAGVSTDDSLVQSSYSSSDVPPLLNAEHDVVYFAGHGEYNVISTYSGSFMAGNSATQGDTDDTDSVDGAVIITAGCHNGVNFGNMLYHAPDAGTTYSEFPEEFAENGVVAYIGATGYTAISGSGPSTTTSLAGANEKLATNVVYYTVNCVDIGRAFRNGANDYYVESSPIQNVDRRVLAIPTLYGIPTYRDPVTPESAQAPGMTPAAGTNVMRAEAAAGLSEIVTVDVSDYIAESSGIITLPGVEQVVSFNKPILPQVFVERTFPRDSVVSVEWLEDASEYVVIKNNVPIAGIACRNVSIPGQFYYQGFWPLQPHRSYQSLTFGAAGSEVGFVAYPVQYNMATGETKIWTRMKFSVTYKVRPTDISVVRLHLDKSEYSQDKPLYSSDDTMKLNMAISSRRHTSLMNLGMVMRNMDTGKEIGRMEIGRIGLKGGAITSAGYLVDLGSVPPNMLEGRTVAAELIVSDSHNGDILTSKSFEFEVAGKPRIFFSTEEDFVTQGPEPHDGNPIISDGDLLCSDGTIIARNRELLKTFETEFDLGLDASDVIAIDAKEHLVAFSTELDDPKWQFTAGDLLTTTGAVIPNIALLAMFDIPGIDLGLDAVHFTGDYDGIIKFIEYIADEDADAWRKEPEMLSRVLEGCDIDIWFSTEGTAPKPGDPLFLDGDLLSARYGTIVARNSELLPASLPAGIPDRGVDFGLDAATTDRTGNARLIRFSTEILYEGRLDFTDGDILRINNGVVCTNDDLIVGFEPNAGFLGLDALSIAVDGCEPGISVKKVVWDDAEQVWADEITAYVGDTVTFECAIHNDGCYSLYDISARDVLPDILEYAGDATVNGEPCEPDAVEDTELEWFFEGPLNPSETITIGYDAYVVECGKGANIHTVKAICEETGEVVHGEGGASITVSCTEAPDLVITGIEGVGIIGKPLNIAYTIKNQGNAIAGTSYTGLYIDGEHVAKDPVDSLEPGDVIEGAFNYLWECEAGEEAKIKVCADIADQVTENDESNNCITEVWTCGVPPPIGLDIYFADAKESPGSVYHYNTDARTEDIIYTRPSKRLYSFAFHPKIPEKLYYVNANEDKIYRTHQISTGWAPEEVVYTHDTYIRDVAFTFDKEGELGLYFSEATGAGGDGKIYRIEDGYATPYYTVKLADVGGSWAGDFAFDNENNLYLSSGNSVPAEIYKVNDGSVEELYKDDKEPIKGLMCEDGVLYYANWRTTIYRLDPDTGDRTVVYSNPERGWLSDVGFR